MWVRIQSQKVGFRHSQTLPFNSDGEVRTYFSWHISDSDYVFWFWLRTWIRCEAADLGIFGSHPEGTQMQFVLAICNLNLVLVLIDPTNSTHSCIVQFFKALTVNRRSNNNHNDSKSPDNFTNAHGLDGFSSKFCRQNFEDIKLYISSLLTTKVKVSGEKKKERENGTTTRLKPAQ